MELMENDMAILQQLLNLGDQVTAMRKKGLRRTQSTNSMERAEEDDEFDVNLKKSAREKTKL